MCVLCVYIVCTVCKVLQGGVCTRVQGALYVYNVYSMFNVYIMYSVGRGSVPMYRVYLVCTVCGHGVCTVFVSCVQYIKGGLVPIYSVVNIYPGTVCTMCIQYAYTVQGM